MEILLESLQSERHNLVRISPRILVALFVLILFVIFGRLLGRAVVAIVARGNFKPTHRSFFRSLTGWLFGLIGLILALNVLGLKSLAASLVAGGGITAVVLGFAFREIGENFLAGFFLAFSRPFEVGDLVQCGDMQGIVRGIELRSTHIRAADGRDIFIPSSQIFNNPLVNFTKDGLRRLSFVIGIDYSDGCRKVRELLIDTVSGIEQVLTDPAPGAIMSALAPTYVELEVFFWVDMFRKGTELLAVRSEAIERCRLAVMTAGFTVSSNVTTNVSMATPQALSVQVAPHTG